MATAEHPAPEGAPAPPSAQAGAEPITVVNPATGRAIGTVPDLDAGAVAALVARARAAQPDWQALGFAGRTRVLRRAQRWVVDHADELVGTIVAETGKAYADALLTEVNYVACAYAFWAKHAEGFLADE